MVKVGIGILLSVLGSQIVLALAAHGKFQTKRVKRVWVVGIGLCVVGTVIHILFG